VDRGHKGIGEPLQNERLGGTGWTVHFLLLQTLTRVGEDASGDVASLRDEDGSPIVLPLPPETVQQQQKNTVVDSVVRSDCVQ